MEQKAHPKQVPKKILARTTVKWHVSLVTIKSVYGKKWESVTPMMEQKDGTFPKQEYILDILSFISGIGFQSEQTPRGSLTWWRSDVKRQVEVLYRREYLSVEGIFVGVAGDFHYKANGAGIFGGKMLRRVCFRPTNTDAIGQRI